MNYEEWKKYRDVLDKLNEMERGCASEKVTEILKFIMESIKPKNPKLKKEDEILNNIPEWGSQSSLNFDEWQRQCRLAQSSDWPKDHIWCDCPNCGDCECSKYTPQVKN